MNHLLKTNNITRNRTAFEVIAAEISAAIHIVSVESDLFFTADENRLTYAELKKIKSNVYYKEIKSIHGHDAFLIEFEQLNKILAPIFISKKHKNYVHN